MVTDGTGVGTAGVTGAGVVAVGGGESDEPPPHAPSNTSKPSAKKRVCMGRPKGLKVAVGSRIAVFAVDNRRVTFIYLFRMTTITPGTAVPAALSADDFDELDQILDDLRSREEETPQWEFCEGFMAALVCCRRLILPSEYFPELLSLQPDETRLWSPFASEAQFERFSSLWLQRYEEVKTALCAEVDRLDDAAAYAPEIMDLAGAIAALTAEQRAELGDAPVPSFAQIWAIGFMFAVETWPEEWTPPRDREAAKLLDTALQCIVTLTEDDTATPATPGDGQNTAPTLSEQRLDHYADAIWAVYDLHDLWQQLGPRVETVYADAKPGRNDPCLCGSGKKYKKCCGMG
jgi:uncharacterized protein